MSDFKTYQGSLIWETERPIRGGAKQSPCFLLSGEEWYLKLERIKDAICTEVEYHLRLCSQNVKKNIKTNFSGTCHAVVNRLSCGTQEQFTVQNPGDTILKCQYDDYNRHFGCVKWKVHCHFNSAVEPLSVQTCFLSTGSSTSSKQTSRPGIPPDLDRLSDELSCLLEKEIIPDATLTCGSRTCKVHRSILTVRSEVFAALFRSGMSESKSGAIRVDDLDPIVLESLLKYIYGGKVQDVSDEHASGMYEAADRYALHGLRKLLSAWMVKHLSSKNCLGFLVVADAHVDAALREAAVAFIVEHFAQIEKAVWTDFRKEHWLLAIEVLENFAPKMKK